MFEVRSTVQQQPLKYATSPEPSFSRPIVQTKKITNTNENWADFDAPISPTQMNQDIMQLSNGFDAQRLSSTIPMKPERPLRPTPDVPTIQVSDNSFGQSANHNNLPIDDNPW